MPDEEKSQDETEVEDEETLDEKPPPNKGHAVGELQRTPE